jgi:hypothetical protein
MDFKEIICGGGNRCTFDDKTTLRIEECHLLGCGAV